MRGVAQQRDPSLAPPRQRVLVDHGKFQNRLGGANESGNIEPIEVPILVGTDEVGERAAVVPVALRVF